MRGLRWAAFALAGLALLLGVLAWLADTDVGHRLIAERIEDQRPRSGLRIRIGRIDGSIYGAATVTGLELHDPKGKFFDSPKVELDWHPLAWLGNRLDIDALVAHRATLHRLPELRPGDPDAPILPGFDIRIGRLAIDELTIGAGVAGERRTGKLAGTADIRDGRALVKLDADAQLGDRLTLALDAEPDRNRFDADATLEAPAGGVFGAMLGVSKPVSLRLAGDGGWAQWRGRLDASSGAARLAGLRVSADAGRYGVEGDVVPAALASGRLARLTAPAVRLRGSATLDNRRLDTQMSLASAALAANAKGVIDLRNSAFDDMLIDARLLQPRALFPNMTGDNIALKLRLDGGFSRASFDYLLTAPRVAFDRTGLEGVRASGQGRLSAAPVRVPLRLSAQRVTGLGDVAGGILRNISVEGPLLISAKTIVGNGLRLRSDKLQGKLALFVDLATGRFDIGLEGQLGRYLIPGIGIVDVKSELKVVPGPGGKGMRIVGRGQAWVRRFDNAVLASLAGGLPRIDTGLERGPDGVLYLRNLKLTGPGIALSGNGYRRVDGSFHFEGAGRQRDYGPLRLTLDGAIERPKLDLFFTSPNRAAGLRNVRLRLDPTAQGFSWTAEGGSTAGPFRGRGAILLPPRQTAVIQIDSLAASGISASGRLVSASGALQGRLQLSGPVSGQLDLQPAGGVQRILASLRARDARLEGPPRIAIRRGTFDGTILLDPKGTSIDGTVTGQGVQYGTLAFVRLAANLNLRGGIGEIRGSAAGSRGRQFDLQAVAQVAPDRIELVASGTVDRRPLRLAEPAILLAEAGGWRLQPARIDFAGGSARIGGLFGAQATELDGTVTRMPLAILDVLNPDLRLGGVASGSFAYRLPAGGDPAGKADLQVKGLTRAGLALASRPIDMGIAATLSGDRAGARLVAASGGQTLGRAQVQLTDIPGGGDIVSRMMDARLFAQLRYSGPADTLWRLTGVDAFDLSGGVAIGADVTGRMSDPRLRGSLRTANARIESAASGTVLSNVKASGTFNGSRLVIDGFAANAGRGGTVEGTGLVDFADGTPKVDLRAQAVRAALLARDDVAATVTGPLRIRSDAGGGVISGDVALDQSSFRLGRATAAAGIPRLNVREVNTRADAPSVAAPGQPWRLAIKARAGNRVRVTGLGIDSEWSADLDIAGTVEAPAIAGRADLVSGGYEFAGKRFELKRGVIRFQGASPPDPILDIVAEGSANSVNATIRVAGTGQRPEIAFSSVPALPQDELLSRMLFGASITSLSAPEAVQLAAAVAALRGGGGLDPINSLRRAVGLDRLRIIGADTTTGQGTSIALGKYITRRTYVEIVTDGQGYSATRAEFQVTRWLSILSTISTIGRQSATIRVSRDY
jgi:translocation and assembly module TamB